MSSFYGLNGCCKNCLTDGAEMFERSRNDGLYKVVESGKCVDVILNNQTKSDDAKWMFDLSLSTNYLNVITGEPVNRKLLVDAVNPFDSLVSLCGVFMDGCTIIDNKTKRPIRYSSSIKNGSDISFCYQVVVSGIIKGSYYVEMGTQMKDIEALSLYFDEQYAVMGVSGGTKVMYNSTSVVNKNINIEIVKRLRVTFGKPYDIIVYVNPGGSFGEIEKEYGLQLDEFVFIVNYSEIVLTKSSVIETDIDLDVFCNVTFSGVFMISTIVEYGSTLGEIDKVQPFWNDGFSLLDPTNKTKVYSTMTSVLHNMEIAIVKNTRVIIVIDPVDDVSTSDIVSSISTIVNVDPGQIIVDVVRNDDGQVTEITVIVRDEETASTIVDTINSIDTGSGCGVGVLCRRKQAFIEVETSCGHLPFVSLFAFLIAIFMHHLF